jgi:hypothetical protein
MYLVTYHFLRNVGISGNEHKIQMCVVIFLFCTFNTVRITLKRISKRSSFRYRFQEHLVKFLMLAALITILNVINFRGRQCSLKD